MNVRQITNELFTHQKSEYSLDVNGNTPFEGYMVGGEVPSLVLEHDHPYPYLSTDKWLTENEALLNLPGYYAGIWVDANTDTTYIDISRNVPDLYTALALASARNELAVWDVINGREVRTEVVPV